MGSFPPTAGAAKSQLPIGKRTGAAEVPKASAASVNAAAAGLTAFSQVPVKTEEATANGTNTNSDASWQALTAASAMAAPLPQNGPTTRRTVKADKDALMRKRAADSMDIVGTISPKESIVLPSTANDQYADHGSDWVSGCVLC